MHTLFAICGSADIIWRAIESEIEVETHRTRAYSYWNPY